MTSFHDATKGNASSPKQYDDIFRQLLQLKQEGSHTEYVLASTDSGSGENTRGFEDCKYISVAERQTSVCEVDQTASQASTDPQQRADADMTMIAQHTTAKLDESHQL